MCVGHLCSDLWKYTNNYMVATIDLSEQQEANSLSPPALSPPSTRSLRNMGPESPTQNNWRNNSAIFSIIPQISNRKIVSFVGWLGELLQPCLFFL